MSPRRAGAAALALLALAVFAALGSWQLQRRAWKLDLIARVEQRVHAPPAPAPGPERWPAITANSDEYRRVHVTGEFLHERETLVQASTALGSGFWVMTPLRTADRTVVLVNRGFVAPERRERASRTASETKGEATVTGLLRMSEPAGGLMGLLRRNDPAANRWYWRDVQAIATARGLEHAAPYFIDAEASATTPQVEPIGGMTVIAFSNNHLVYALTWYALALMAAGAAWRVLRLEDQG
jgi:surfeit locus 1 family protein